MTEETAKAGAENTQQFVIQRVYLKDVSFEAPMGAKAFMEQVTPKIEQEMGTSVDKVADDLYEMTLKLTVTAKSNDQVVFLVEVQQAGLFFIKGIEGSALSRVLNTMAPQILFPYAREAIDNVLLKGSFPPLALPPVNFDALYSQAMAEQKKAAH